MPLYANIAKIQALLDEGKTHYEIAHEAGVSVRTVSRWLSNGLLSRPSAGPATRVSIAEPVSEAQQDWTARDLLDMGMSPDLAARTIQLLENATEIGSVRIREWFSNYIPMAAETPEVWAATIAFFQILARDIHNPALATLGELMHGSVPWKDGQLRRRYNRLARPLLREARVEFQEFLTFTPNTEKNPELPLQEYEVVLEAMKRCPNVDRPVRRRRPLHKEDKLFGLHMVREMPMAALAITWCRLMDRNPAWLKAYGDYKLGLH